MARGPPDADRAHDRERERELQNGRCLGDCSATYRRPSGGSVVTAFADSLTGVLLYAAPLVAIGCALSLLLRRMPLRTTLGDEAALLAAASTAVSTLSTTH
jgi:hypothetical protein